MMAKITCSAFLLFLQLVFCGQLSEKNEFYEYKLANEIDVILHEDFRMPLVLVGIIFDTGSFNEPINKNGITQIIAANLISKKLCGQFRDLGISCQVNVSGAYTEILAKMNPRYLKKFFNLVCKNISQLSLDNLEILKKQMIIDRKLAHYCFEDAVENMIFANINMKNINVANQILNEKSLSSISEKDVNQFFDQHYKNCHLVIIVTGAIERKKLKEMLGSTANNLARRKDMSLNFCNDHRFKKIHIENKHVGRAVRYFYKIPQKDNIDLSDVFFYIFDHEAFKFFRKMDPLIAGGGGYKIVNKGDCIQEIYWTPKMDVSMEKLQRVYEVFVNRMCKQDISAESLSKIAELSGYEKQFLFSNMYDIYFKILNAYLSGKNINSICEIENNIRNANPENLKAFAEKILRKNLIFQITTRYKSDK